MANDIKVDVSRLTKIREANPRLVSYNVEMTEVTGGTFWKPYTPEQIAGREPFPQIRDMNDISGLMAVFEPLDMGNRRLRELAKALGPVYIRVSGSWATGTYYDFDGHTGGNIPEGFRAVLTKEQWEGVLDFVKEVGAKLLVSVANSEGVHKEDGIWDDSQARLLFDFSREYGVPIAASEFMNEPNTMVMGGTPENYTIADFGRDQDCFYRLIREQYPDTLLVGPCACGDQSRELGVGSAFTFPPTTELLNACNEQADVFSYHYYAGISERGAVMGGHWDAEDALSEAYLNVAASAGDFYAKMRDEYCPGAEMWVTESADAGCGGNTWGSTYLDVIRYADELARFCTITDGVIFHNTLTSSDYGLLDHKDHSPRPNYWLALLWNRLVGTTVYDTGEEIREGAHVYAHSRKDGREGYVYILINNSKTEKTPVEIPVAGDRYTLSAVSLRSREIMLNGKTLELNGEYGLPELAPEQVAAGVLELAPATVTFLVI